MNFSKRTSWDLSENDFAKALQLARGAGKELIDLAVANPTSVGFQYDVPEVLEPLSALKAARYDPHPLGAHAARAAVAEYYAEHRAAISPDAVCLTTSTSEAYSFLFRLLCDPGDEVLIAQPSYPLFDFIAQLDDVRLKQYPLFYDGDWHIDLQALEGAITSRTKAMIVVHPNNPTGNYASVMEREALREICARHEIALIVDEVFLDYTLRDGADVSFVSSQSQALTFVLSGVSKVCGLPQMKLSWIAACGPERRVGGALERLEVIADTFLSVGAPTQHALPFWLSARGQLQQQIRARMAENLHVLNGVLSGSHANRLSLQGGWTAVLRVPRDVGGVPFAIAALHRQVVVQPGEFYGLSTGHVVLSLLTPKETLKLGLEALPIR